MAPLVRDGADIAQVLREVAAATKIFSPQTLAEVARHFQAITTAGAGMGQGTPALRQLAAASQEATSGTSGLATGLARATAQTTPFVSGQTEAAAALRTNTAAMAAQRSTAEGLGGTLARLSTLSRQGPGEAAARFTAGPEQGLYGNAAAIAALQARGGGAPALPLGAPQGGVQPTPPSNQGPFYQQYTQQLAAMAAAQQAQGAAAAAAAAATAGFGRTVAAAGAGTTATVAPVQTLGAALTALMGGGPGGGGGHGGGGGFLGGFSGGGGGFLGYLAGGLAVQGISDVAESLGHLTRAVVDDGEQWILAQQSIQFALQTTSKQASDVREHLLNQSKGVSFDSTLTTFQRVSSPLSEAGFGTAAIERVTRSLQELGAVSGTQPGRAARAIYEIAEAFSTGNLKGQQFRTAVLDMPAILVVLQQALGVSREKLLEMGHAGELSGEMIARALITAAPELDRQFGSVGNTVTRAGEDIRNAWVETAGKTAEQTELVKNLAAAYETFADVLRSDAFKTVLGSVAQFVSDVAKGIADTEMQIAKLKATVGLGPTPTKGEAPASIDELMAEADRQRGRAADIREQAPSPQPTPLEIAPNYTGPADRSTLDAETLGRASAAARGPDQAPGTSLVDVLDRLATFLQTHDPFYGPGSGTPPPAAVPSPAAAPMPAAAPSPAAVPMQENFYGGPVPPATGPGLTREAQEQLAQDIGAVLRRAAAIGFGEIPSPSVPRESGNVEVASTPAGDYQPGGPGRTGVLPPDPSEVALAARLGRLATGLNDSFGELIASARGLAERARAALEQAPTQAPAATEGPNQPGGPGRASGLPEDFQKAVDLMGARLRADAEASERAAAARASVDRSDEAQYQPGGPGRMGGLPEGFSQQVEVMGARLHADAEADAQAQAKRDSVTQGATTAAGERAAADDRASGETSKLAASAHAASGALTLLPGAVASNIQHNEAAQKAETEANRLTTLAHSTADAQRYGADSVTAEEIAEKKLTAALELRIAKQKEVADLQIKRDTLANKVADARATGENGPKYLSALEAELAQTEQQLTSEQEKERTSHLSAFTGKPFDESQRIAGRVFAADRQPDELAGARKQVAEDRQGIASAKEAGDVEGQRRATAALTADTTRLAEIGQRRAETEARGREALTGQADAAARLAADLEKVSRASRPDAQGITYLRTPAQRAEAQKGAYDRFATGVEQESRKGTEGQPERRRDEAAISALLAQETAHVGARAALEERIGQIRGHLAEIDKTTLAQWQTEDDATDATIAKAEARLSRLKAGMGGDITTAIEDARDAAESRVKILSAKEMESPGAAGEEVRRGVQRELLGDTAATTAMEEQKRAAMRETETSVEKYAGTVKLSSERLKAGILDQEHYNRAVLGAAGPLQTFSEESDRIGAVQASVNQALIEGSIGLDEYRQRLAELGAERGRNAATQRSGQIQQEMDRGEQGSGVPMGEQFTGGLRAGGLQVVQEYGNAAKQTADLTKFAIEGMTDAVTQGIMTGHLSLQKFGLDLEEMGLKMFEQILIARALGALLGGLGGGGAGAGLANFQMTGGTGGAYGSARGNAFENGEQVPMARGGILSRETLIPMARGGYADAGEVPSDPESVMPLKRTSRGDLGVQVADGGRGGGDSHPNVVINNHGEAIGKADSTWDPDSRTLELTVHGIVNDGMAKGRYTRSMRQVFGTSPSVRR